MEQIGTKTEYVFGIHLARVDDPRLHRCHHCFASSMSKPWTGLISLLEEVYDFIPEFDRLSCCPMVGSFR
jgi:hypothetical protein